VAQVVEPDAAEPCAPVPPVPMSEVIGVKRRAVRIAEHQATLEATREPGQRRPHRRR
jgi:hypothetical protein